MLNIFIECLFYSFIILLFYKIFIYIIFKKFKNYLNNFYNMYYQINEYYIFDLSFFFILLIFNLIINLL